MDPFLEAPSLWSAAHTLLIGGLTRALNRGLPSAYFAKPNERVYVVDDDRSIFPDGAVIHDPMNPRARRGSSASAVADPPLLYVPAPHEVVEAFIDVVRADGTGRIVATIEILSPRNKTKRHEGRKQYLLKQKEVLASPAHLVEIDLLRKGPHTVAAPRSWLNQHDPWHYVVSLHRGGGNGRFEAWVATVRSRLPKFFVPLDPDDDPVTVDLQALLAECYTDGLFNRQIDYSGAIPPPPLPQADQEWIAEIVKAMTPS